MLKVNLGLEHGEEVHPKDNILHQPIHNVGLMGEGVSLNHKGDPDSSKTT
jgi:hypothetical protein